jgi:hypothetical protein
MEAVPRMASVRAWYVGRQSASNELIDRPPSPYVCELLDGVAQRAWYAGALSLLR